MTELGKQGSEYGHFSDFQALSSLVRVSLMLTTFKIAISNV